MTGWKRAASLAAAAVVAFSLAAAVPPDADAAVHARPSAKAAPKAPKASKPATRPNSAKPKKQDASAKTAAMNRAGGYAAACRAASAAPRIAKRPASAPSGMFSAGAMPCPYPWWLVFGDGAGEGDEEEKPEWMEENERWGDV